MRAFNLSRLRPLGLALSLALAYPVAQALPQGAQVVQGKVVLNPGLIQQGSDKAVVNWQSFSIATGETLRIEQPGVNSVLLNRVVGGDPSLILGRMQANGQVFLVNPRGIVFGRGSQVDVGGLVASTLDLSDTNFLAGNYRFSAGAQAGALQADGSITAAGGTVALLAPQLSVGGSIDARRVGLAAAGTVQVDVEGDGLVLFNLRNDDRDVALKFNGRIAADGGSAELRAQARAGAAGQVLNMDGVVQARGLRQQGGRIVIDGGTAGDTLVNGSLDATGDQGGGITVLGQRVALLDKATLDASGLFGGGSLQVGGGFEGQGTEHNAERTVVTAGARLKADAANQGDGGKIAVWADGRTDMLGQISARGGRLGGNGGMVETSGRQQLNLPSGGVDVSAPKGNAGRWLLDPNDLSIVAGSGLTNVSSASPFTTTDDSASLGVDVLNAALSGGANVVVQTTNSGAAPAQAGNITVAANILSAGSATLNLNAIGSINYSGFSIGAGSGALNVVLQAGGSVTGGTIATGGGTVNATGSGSIALGSVTSAGLTIVSNSGTVTLPTGTVGALDVTTSNGAVTQSGALAVTGTTSLSTGSGNITLTAANNLQGTVSLTTTGVSQVSNDTGNALTLGTLSTGALTASTANANLQLGSGTVGGNLVASASGTGTITQAGALTVTGTSGLSNGAGGITLTSANDLQGAVNVTTTGTALLSNGAGNALTLGTLSTHALTASTSGADLQLGSGTVTGNLNATTTGAGTITQGGALTVTGTSTLSNGSGNITLTSANDLQGAVSLTTTGTTQIGNASGNALTLGTLNTRDLTVSTSSAHLQLGSGTIGGNLSATTTGTGTITQGGALTVTGTTALSNGSGNITLTSANDLQGAVSLTTTGTTQISNGSGNALTLGTLITHGLTASTSSADLQLGSGTVTGSMSATTTGSGTITQAGALTVTGATALSNGSGDITLTSANNLQAAVNLTTTGTALLSNASGNALTLGTLSTHDLTVSTSSANLQLGSGTVTGNLSATTTGTGTITQGGALTVTGTTALSNGSGNITLGAANDLQGAVSVTTTGTSQLTNASGNALTLGTLNTHALTVNTSNADLQLGSGTVTGNLSATTTGTGTITQGGALTVTGTSTLGNGSGAITLTSANDLQGSVNLTTTGVTQIGNASGKALTLGILNTRRLTVSTSNANLQLGSGSVTGNLAATTTGTGTITQGGALTVTGTSTLGNGSGDITLTSANDLQGAVNLTTTGATQISNGAGNALTLGTLSTHALTVSTSSADLQLGSGTVTGNLVATTTGIGTITQGGAMAVTGTTTLSNGSGDITLTSANNLQGAVSLSTTGATRLANGAGHALTLGTLSAGDLTVSSDSAALTLGTGTVTGALDANSQGGLLGQAAGGLTVTGAATLAAGSGNISLTDTSNHWNGVTLSGNSLDLRSAGNLDILGLTQPVNRALTLSAGGNLTLGALTDIDTGSANLSLTSLGGSFTAGGKLTGNNITVAAQTGLSLAHDITAAGTLDLSTVSGGINQTAGRIAATGTTTVAAGTSAISLNRAGNHFGGAVSLTGGVAQLTDNAALTLGTLATGNLTVASHGVLDLGQGSVTGTLNATSTGSAITQTAGLTLTGTTMLNAGTADITLSQALNDLQGAITATGGAVSLRSANNLHLFALTQPLNKALVLEAGGTLTLPAGTTNIDTGTAALTLSSGGVFNTFGTLKGGNVTLKGQSPTLGHNITASGNLDVHSTTGAITQPGGRISVVGTSQFNAATFGITLNRPLNDFQGNVSLMGGAAQIVDTNGLTLAGMAVSSLQAQAGGALALGTGTLSGNLSATAGSTITQAAGGLRVTGTSSFSASTAITLLDTGNAWTGAVSLSGGASQLYGGGAVTLGGGSVSSLALTTGGAVSQAGGLSVSGALTVNTGGAPIDLSHSGNHLNGTVTLTGGATQVSSAGPLSLGNLSVGALTLQSAGTLNLGQGNIGGNLVANSGGGSVTQAGVLHVGGTANIQAGGGGITLTQGSNTWGGALSLGGGVVQVASNAGLTLGALAVGSLAVDTSGPLSLGQGNVAGGLTANSHGGAITQAGALDVTGLADLQAGGGSITLNQAGNHWGGVVQLSGGTTQISNTGALTLGTLATGNLSATSSGALNLGQGAVSGNLVATAGGVVTQTGALQVSGSATINAGAADITLTNTGNRFLGPLSLTGGAVALFNQPDLTLGTLSFNSLDATSNGSITLGTGTLSGALIAKALGGTVTQSAGGISVAGMTTLQATGAITLTDAANHLQGPVNLSGGATALSNATGLTLGTVATGKLTLNVAGPLNLGTGSIGGDLTATSSGATTQTGALSVSGAASLDAGSAAITLGQIANAFAGPVSLRGGNTLLTNGGTLTLATLNVGDLTLSSRGALQLGSGSLAGELKASSGGGAISQSMGGLRVAGASTLDAGSANIVLTEAANAFAGTVSLLGGNVDLNNSIALRLGSVTTHDLKLGAGGDIDLGTSSVDGDLVATTQGTRIGQTGTLTVKGAATFIADGSLVDLVLDQPANQLLGAIAMRGIHGGSFVSADISSLLDLSFSGDVKTLRLSSGGLLTLGGGRSTTLTAAARRGIVQTGALDVSGLTTLVANGGAAMPVDLNHAGNDFSQVLLKSLGGGSMGAVLLRDGDASRHDGLRVSGDAGSLAITSAGALDLGGGRYASLAADTSAGGAAITQSGAMNVSGLTALKAGSGDITLTRDDNSLGYVTVGSAGIASLVSAGGYTVNASSVSTRLEVAGPGAISLVGPLSGSGELLMSGSGSLTVSTGQSYSGGTRIQAGRVVLQGAAAQAGSGAVQLGAAGQLDLRDGATLTSALVAQGGDVLNTSGSGTLSGAVTLLADTTFLPAATTAGLTISGAVSGQGLRLGSAGTLTLTGSNSYTGTTDIAAGSLRANGAGSLPSTSAVQLAAGAVLSLGHDQTAGSISGAGPIELGSFTLATGADGSDTTFSGSLAGSGGLTKLGSGRFTLAGSGAHTGATRVSSGELVLASSNALNDVTAVSVEAGALLTVQQSANLGSLAGAGTVDLQAPLLSIGSNGASTRFDGAINGSGGLTKLGAGVFTLAGHNALAGDLQVNAGTLQLDGEGVVPATAGVGVAAGATLELLASQDLGGLSGSGRVLLNPHTLTLGASGRDSRFDGVIQGSGGLTKAGTGTLTLGGANLYAGRTLVAGGTLALATAQALAVDSALVINTPGRVQANAAQAVASLNGTGGLELNGATLASGADGGDSRFDGVISGSGGLVKQGGGVLTLTAANRNSGATVIEAGSLRLTGSGSLGAGEIQNQGQLRLERSDALTLNQVISGRGSLVVNQGQVTLANAANSYTGATQVLGGSLITTAAERLPDASAVQVAAGAQLQLGGNETIASLQAAGSVRLAGDLTTRAEQVYAGSLTLANTAGLMLSGTLIDASRSTNQFAGTPLSLSGGRALITVKETLQLGNVTLSNGGRIEAERLALAGKLQLTAGSLGLIANAAPDDAKATLQGTVQVPVAGQPMAIAETTVQQGSASTITLAEGASLAVLASGGGSVLLGQDGNSFKGQLSVLSGASYNTAWVPNAKAAQAVQSLVRVSGQQVLVGGSGIEADTIYIRADQLATAGTARLVARLPFDEIVLGKVLSAPGMTLELSAGAFGLPGSFGSVNGQPIQIEVGSTETGARTIGPNAGYLTVLPKAGAQGATAVVLVGPKVGSALATGGPAYRFFHDGASQATEVPVVYNGVLPLTPAASGAISSINGDAEDARRARFQETVRTENVTVRLRSGVIAEVGPGRPSTQGSEGAKPPEPCDPAAQPVLSCK